MFEILKPKISYTHGGELFSKILLCNNTIKKTNTSLILVVGTTEIQKKYILLAKDLKIPFNMGKSYHDIAEIGNTEGGILSVITIDQLGEYISPHIIDQGLDFRVGESYNLQGMLGRLQELGYEFSEYSAPGSYKKQGDILTLTQISGNIVTLSFWGDELESIDSDNVKSLESLKIQSLGNIQSTANHDRNISLKEYISEKKYFCILDMLEFHPDYENLIQSLNCGSFDILGNNIFTKKDIPIRSVSCQNLQDFRDVLEVSSHSVHIYTRHKDLIQKFISDNNIRNISVVGVNAHLYTSFQYSEKNIFLSDDSIGKIFIKKRSKKKLSADVDLLLKIAPGDYIVHIDHGIGVFQKIIKKTLGNIEKEYLEIHYQNEDKLFVPITEIARVSKYVGSENPKLTPLSGKVWEKKMKKIHEDIREIAEGLLKNFAERKIRYGEKLIYDEKKISAFQSEFPYTYTDDQANAIEDITSDMLSDKNMDRLIVGDVGFGKTEIAFQAAYLALTNKKQVLFLSPLVVLSHEHYAKALERFENTDFTIGILTRLQSQREATAILKGLESGSIDMVIGTHRLLSEKTTCKNLGLMIVDEEHKFGVVDKEKIKQIKANIDILSLSATPIPRSLNLALSGVRDISLLKTPPSGRKSIQTYVSSYNEKIIQDAGNLEFARGGQVFFVHNRVANIEVYKKQIQALFPTKKIIITHGQLNGDELEERILDFKNKKYDILLSTTVIENGIDFSNVNTIFINECQQFGISQIHQLRGRVGRSRAQGYCYLLYKKEHLDTEAAKRIQTIVDYSYLGAGFELAMKDLEIRGGGDILGVRQSGQSKEIGVSLFLKMLEEKIEDLKQEKSLNPNGNSIVGDAGLRPLQKTPPTHIDLSISASIPDDFFLTEADKLHFYREIECIQTLEDLEYSYTHFVENNSQSEVLPKSIENLFLILRCQILAKKFHISRIKKAGINYQIEFIASITLDQVKNFLHRDYKTRFNVIDIQKLRCPVKGFANDKNFILYVVSMLSEEKKISQTKKFRLKQ